MFSPLPCGFVAALDVLSDLDADAVTQLANAALDELSGDATRASGTDVVYASLADKAGGAGPPVTVAQLDSAVNALGHVYRAAAGAGAGSEQLSAGLATFLTPGGRTSAAMCTAWDARRASVAAGGRNPGQAAPRFEALSWEVSAVMASWAAGAEHGVDTTPRPFVAACLRMQGGSDVTVEMSIAQFKELLAAVRGAHKALAPLTA